MSIQDSDKLLVGRDGSSFQTTFDQSGIATSQYVDTGLALKLDKAGDTMTGDLTLSSAPTADLHAASKKYVDDNISELAMPKNLNTLPSLV